MPDPKWYAGLPPPATAVGVFPACDDDELDLHQQRIVGAGWATPLVMTRPEIVDVVLSGCDVAGLVSRDGRAARVLIEQSRLRGVTWANGMVEDVVVDGITAADLSVRFSTLRRVVFRDCSLPGLDLTETSLDDVRFERCALTRVQWDHARVKQLRIEGCDLTGCTGADALRGASIHPDDLLTLAPSLAVALGITLE